MTTVNNSLAHHSCLDVKTDSLTVTENDFIQFRLAKNGIIEEYPSITLTPTFTVNPFGSTALNTWNPQLVRIGQKRFIYLPRILATTTSSSGLSFTCPIDPEDLPIGAPTTSNYTDWSAGCVMTGFFGFQLNLFLVDIACTCVYTSSVLTSCTLNFNLMQIGPTYTAGPPVVVANAASAFPGSGAIQLNSCTVVYDAQNYLTPTN